jgi:chorismate mutase
MAERKPVKTENGMEFPAEAYAYVPDPEKPSTWKLRLWEDPEQKETPRQVGMAVAALSPGGFRGNRVEIPPEDLPKVKARVRAAWKKVHPDADPEDMPPVLREGADMDGTSEGTRLLEYANSANLTLRVDRERGVIQGVKILGLSSANRRTYLPEALRQAVKLYEGVAVNVDHIRSGELRSYRDRIGKLVNVRFANDGLYGDLVVNPKHPLAEQLFWDAEHNPENVGLSHDARGRTVVRNGQVVVEAIEAVRSVDLVAEPATTKSLYEAAVDAVLADPEPETADQEPDADQQDDGASDPIDDPDTLPDEAFALVLPGGVKIRDKTYPLHKRYFPIHNRAAVLRSLKAIASNRKLSAHHRELALQRAKDAARTFGIDPESILTAKESRSMDLTNLTLAELKEARPDLVEALLAQHDVQRELLALKEERDRLARELAEYKRRDEVQRELQEAGLALESIPETLRGVLLKTEDKEERKKLVQDFRNLIKEARAPVSSRPGVRKTAEDIEEIIASWRF